MPGPFIYKSICLAPETAYEADGYVIAQVCVPEDADFSTENPCPEVMAAVAEAMGPDKFLAIDERPAIETYFVPRRDDFQCSQLQETAREALKKYTDILCESISRDDAIFFACTTEEGLEALKEK